MIATLSRTQTPRLASPRVLLALLIAFGLLAMQTGRGTLAYFTDTKSSASNVFTAGKLDIQASTLGTFSWDTATSVSSTKCAAFTGTANTSQALTPGVFCMDAMTIDPGTTSVTDIDYFYRVKLKKTAGASTGADKALTDDLQFTMAEVADPATCTTANRTTVFSNTATYVQGSSTAGVSFGNGGLGLDAASEALLVGTAAIDGSGTPAQTALTPGTTKSWCVMVAWPLGTSGAGNAAMGGTNTYEFELAAAQAANR